MMIQFMACVSVDLSQDLFTRRFALKSEQEDEEQLEIDFEFLTKKEMAEEPHNMTPPFSYIIDTFLIFGVSVIDVYALREEIAECVKAAEAEPDTKIQCLVIDLYMNGDRSIS